MAYIQYGRNAIRQIIKETNVHSSDRMMQPLLYVSQGIRHRKLEVILTRNIEKLGKAGETVKVAPGHFRNHLMPKLLAVPNIDKYAYLIREQHKVVRRLINIEKFRSRSTKDEPIEVREPVTKDDIVAEVARQLCVQLAPENLQLSSPLSTVGEYEVPLRFPKSIPLPAGKVHWTLSVKLRTK
ncbi:uncharacterized protein LOC107403445 isoform X2 [Ziziphus jujuba]|uniref:Large ribosomal subunit protein bL9c n=1 Tax=Ziziphus jujuba TaxID=326968 RepID=A0ABM3ICV1_ZIZJJ|nr:uncharacterized protein LOC107403445 isoform X2 [Ziziphus jujuba]